MDAGFTRAVSNLKCNTLAQGNVRKWERGTSTCSQRQSDVGIAAPAGLEHQGHSPPSRPQPQHHQPRVAAQRLPWQLRQRACAAPVPAASPSGQAMPQTALRRDVVDSCDHHAVLAMVAPADCTHTPAHVSPGPNHACLAREHLHRHLCIPTR